MPPVKKTTTGLAQKLKQGGVKPPRKLDGPLWLGPCDAGPMGGITQSMMSTLLVCRERARLRYVVGLRTAERFEARTEYGSMWHICEEYHAANKDWVKPLADYCKQLCQKHKFQQEDIEKWYNVCKLQFPLYVDYWKKQKDVRERTPVMQEYVFHIPYMLPSGREVFLRGKFDSVDLIGKGKAVKIFLQENKTKSDIDEQKIRRQLRFDLQTMTYLVALEGIEKLVIDCPICGGDVNSGHQKLCAFNSGIGGVRYNVIRRPLSGGKGSIVRHKATKNHPEETYAHYYGRCRQYIVDAPQEFFMRWKVDLSTTDLQRFKDRFLTPFLEQVVEWYDHVSDAFLDPFEYPVPNRTHYQTPFGIYNILAEGGSTDLDEYLETGSEVGLVRVEKLFGELQ